MSLKRIIKYTVYYISVPLVFGLCVLGASLVIPDNASLGTMLVAIYAIVFAAFPVLTAVLMRFSVLPWVIDPFAAAELPVLTLVLVLVNDLKQTGELLSAFSKLSDTLCGGGYIFFAVWYVFALVFTFSLRRPKGDGLTDRILKIFTENKEEGKAE